MHRCLLIDEIFQKILENIYTTRELYSLSLVCRTFLEPVNDELWADLPGLSPLVKCLPDGLIGPSQRDENCLTIVRPPLLSEWHRFEHHARRVREITFTHEENDDFAVDEEAFVILSANHPGPILPQLRTLTWHNWVLAKFAPLFIQPSLISLEFYPTVEEEMEVVLKRVQTSAPQLVSLRLFTADALYGPTNAVFTQTLLSLNHLLGLNFDHVPLETEALAHLSRLPCFITLFLHLLKHDDKLWTSPSWGGFPALKHLSLMPYQEDGVTIPSTPFLHALSGASLTSLDVKMWPPIRFGELSQLLSAIGRLGRLRLLHLEFTNFGADPWAGTVIDGSELAPLYALRSMMTFTMTNAPITFTPPSIRKLARAWKGIHKLTFISPSPAHCHIRLEDIAGFSRNLRTLVALTIQIHPIPDTWEHVGRLRWPPSLVSDLNLCKSRVARAAEARVAEYLAGTFPLARVRHKFSVSFWGQRQTTVEDVEAAAVLENVDRLKKEVEEGALAMAFAERSQKHEENVAQGSEDLMDVATA
ncbi:hypothetical protein PsYK624_164120 [Phanerochaete sordida]|uniref:F-box domain-containing protein n=1 Tax=Phanerochaete sordida TaxID=48140 RepID=A0A9P3GRE7_9APHY|nr:hypothetical protein PsYK624_164120 [Phanerochaete sordida]